MPGRQVPKAKISPIERDSRSRLAQLVSGTGLIRGTLTVREKVCGKTTCQCALGKKHIALYLLSSKDGQVRQVFVPRSREAEVRRWLEQYQRAEQLLEDISDFHWAKIKSRTD